MVMMERFGSPASRIMSVMKSFQIPVRSVQPGDKLLVITDDAMDPLIWQCMMAAINEKGGEAMLCMWPRAISPMFRRWRLKPRGAPM
jgi:aminopeptidase